MQLIVGQVELDQERQRLENGFWDGAFEKIGKPKATKQNLTCNVGKYQTKCSDMSTTLVAKNALQKRKKRIYLFFFGTKKQ